jgi:MFS family permease
MGVGAVSAVSQALITGRLARVFGEDRVLAFGVALFGLSLLVQTQLPNETLVPVVMAFGAFGMALAMPNISALISRSTAPNEQGAMLGLNMATGSLARMFGPILAGFTFSTFGPDAPFLTGAVLVVPAALIALDAGRAFRRTRVPAATPTPAPAK